MSKKSAFDKNSNSRYTLNDTDADDTVSLYGKVNTPASVGSAAILSSTGIDAQDAASTHSHGEALTSRTNTSTALQSSTVSAESVITVTGTSSSVSKVYQHWADGDAAKGTSAEWNNSPPHLPSTNRSHQICVSRPRRHVGGRQHTNRPFASVHSRFQSLVQIHRTEQWHSHLERRDPDRCCL